MPRVPHRIGLAAVFATAALTGTVALSQTVDLGADASEPVTITKKELKKRTKAVKQNDVKLAQALKQRPPALPERPKFDPLPAPVAPPVVVTRMVSAPSASDGGSEPSKRSTSSREPEHHASAPQAAPKSQAAPAPAAPTTHESSEHEDHASENHREDHSNSGEHSEHESDD